MCTDEAVTSFLATREASTASKLIPGILLRSLHPWPILKLVQMQQLPVRSHDPRSLNHYNHFCPRLSSSTLASLATGEPLEHDEPLLRWFPFSALGLQCCLIASQDMHRNGAAGLSWRSVQVQYEVPALLVNVPPSRLLLEDEGGRWCQRNVDVY